MRKIPPLNAIKAFEAAGRHISFTKAAMELCVSHGAISKQVALLEDWLNTRLFIRIQSHLELTEAGKTLLSTVTPALDRIALTSLQLLDKSTPTTLNINAPPTFTMRWLIPRISSFQRKHNDIEIKLTTSTSPIDFREFSYDIAIRGFHEALEIENSFPFMTETIIPICHPDLIEKRKVLRPQDISQHTLISYDTEPMKWAEWALMAKIDSLQTGNALQFEQMYFALQAASEGLGIVLGPLFLVADDIASGRLCAPFGTLGARQRQYFAVSRPGKKDNIVMNDFCNWLSKESAETESIIRHLIDR